MNIQFPTTTVFINSGDHKVEDKVREQFIKNCLVSHWMPLFLAPSINKKTMSINVSINKKKNGENWQKIQIFKHTIDAFLIQSCLQNCSCLTPIIIEFKVFFLCDVLWMRWLTESQEHYLSKHLCQKYYVFLLQSSSLKTTTTFLWIFIMTESKYLCFSFRHHIPYENTGLFCNLMWNLPQTMFVFRWNSPVET